MRWLLVCALLLCGCQKPLPPRVIHIQVAAAGDFRQQANWRDLVARRIRAASATFRAQGIQFELAGVSEWEPDPRMPYEAARWTLGGFHSSGDWLNLGFYGSAQQGAEPGVAVPFDPRVLVYNISGAPENRQAAALAHELGHVLGAWHSPDGGFVMSLPPGEEMDSTAKSLLKVTREVDLSQGASAFSKDLTDRIQKTWTDAKADTATNPLYRFHSSMGTELFRRGSRVDAEENFIQAIKFGPDVAKAHIDLADAELANHEYADAADEFRKAVKLDGHSKAALSGLAAALVGSGHRNEAIQTLAQNIRLNPSDATVHANMGAVLVGTPGRLDEGIAELREALRIDPNREAVKHSLDAALAAKSKGKN